MFAADRDTCVLHLWRLRYDTARIAELLGIPEHEVERRLHRMREEARKPKPKPKRVDPPTPKSVTRTKLKRVNKPKVSIEEALQIARLWESGRPSRH